jgi:hypothetical protein
MPASTTGSIKSLLLMEFITGDAPAALPEYLQAWQFYMSMAIRPVLKPAAAFTA